MTDAPFQASRKSFYQTDFCAREFKLPARRFYQEPGFQYLADEARLREQVQRQELRRKEEESALCDQNNDEEEEEGNKEEEKGKDTEQEKESKPLKFSPLTDYIRNIVEELVKATTYTTTYSSTYSKDIKSVPRSATTTLPYTGIRRADPVRHRAQIYEKRPGLWQVVYSEWDQEQRRKGYNAPGDTANGVANRWAQNQQRQGIRGQTRPARPLSRPQKGALKRVDTTDALSNQDKKQVRITVPTEATLTTECRFPRPPPGYGGYLPRLPTIRSNDTRVLQQYLLSTTRREYRAYNLYTNATEHAHQGPLSKTVTLTHPFNPFNKVDKQPLVLEPLAADQQQAKKTTDAK